MYRCEAESYGLRLTFSGMVSAEEIRQWLARSYQIVPRLGVGFHVFVDMRRLKLLSPAARALVVDGQRYYRKWGMSRSVVIVDSHDLEVEFRRIALETGIYEWERYINAREVENWETAGLAWLERGVDPDHRATGSALRAMR